MKEAYYKFLSDILLGYDRNTPSKITSLRDNQIFVFGTDTSESQRHGAAGLAAKCFGAKVGVVDGPTGKCYTLPTKGFTIEELSKAVGRFKKYVRDNYKSQFLITAIGCDHAGLDTNAIASIFKGLIGLSNVMLPELFLCVYRKECHDYFSLNTTSETKLATDPNEFESIEHFFDEHPHNIVKYLIVRVLLHLLITITQFVNQKNIYNKKQSKWL